MNKAVILDRDGTINVEKNYLYKKEEFEFEFNSDKAIKTFNDLGYKVIVISNQAGIARGYYTESDLLDLHKYIDHRLKSIEAQIDGCYYCPHHPKYGIGKYLAKCRCRKPGTLLYEKAIKEFNIDVTKSFVIGDKITDLIPGKEMNMKTILVGTGYGSQEKEKKSVFDYYCSNLYEASLMIKNL